MNENDNLTIKSLIAFICADVDIFLLKEDDQITDKQRTYSVDEVRAQLEKTASKMCHTLLKAGIDIDEEIKGCVFNKLKYESQG